MKLSEGQASDHVNSGGLTCPYCGSFDITASHMEADESSAWCDIACDDCNATWTNEFELIGVSS